MSEQADWVPDSIDPERPSPARMYDYVLGGGHSSMHFYPRTRAEILQLLAGFELVDPGLIPISRWRPDSENDVTSDSVTGHEYAAVGRKLP